MNTHMSLNRLVRTITRKLGILMDGMEAEIATATLPKFANHPKGLRIARPRRIIHPEHMFLGDNINIGPGSLLIAIKEYPGSFAKHPEKELVNQKFTPKISIGNRVTATANLHIAAHSEITIEDDVLFASNINITDALHGYEHANEAYKFQPLFRIAPILIGEGCWIGQNVVVLPGVTIGKYSIVGANSVVTKSIPAQCIAVGTPARITKTWDDINQKWVSNDKL